jgi:hypothetical protein
MADLPGMKGVEAHRKRLRKMRGPAMIRAVTGEIFGAAKDIANDAALSITSGATSGKNHEPSAPGSPPNADTHVLDRSVDAAVTGPLKAEASADAPYAAAQEFGSEKLGLPERPYMRPAAERGRPKAQQRVVDAVNRVVRASGA